MLAYGGRQNVNSVANAPALDARGVSVRYTGSDELALRDVSLCVPAGARVALVGPNGAGKSTLLKAAAGLLPVAAGALTIYGNLVGACHHRVAYLAQRGEMDWRFPITLRKLVLTGRYVHLGWLKRPTQDDWRYADEAIARMGLTDLAERQIGELSGGQQQRALLARALAQDADLLLLDEPLNAVDAATRHVIADTLADLGRKGKTVIIATHDLDRLEAEFDDALYLLDGHETGRGVHVHASAALPHSVVRPAAWGVA
jgi:manganese/zinc/iron transport system ATP- binding protein